MSYNQNKQKLYDYQQNQMNIVDFYNNVFLNDIQQLLIKYPQSSNILLTPKRLQYTSKYKQGISSTPLRQKLKQSQSIFIKKPIVISSTRSIQHQINIAKNIKIQQQSVQMVDQSQQLSLCGQNQRQNNNQKDNKEKDKKDKDKKDKDNKYHKDQKQVKLQSEKL